jgi:nucleoside-diphosphate-sugar epimerase
MTSGTDLHVIFGTGPVGCWTARALRQMGRRVRAVNRSGRRPHLMPPQVEMISADLSDATSAREAARGASVVYQALNPPYERWHQLFPGLQASALAAAQAENARYVSIENLYMYDASRPISERSTVAPRSKKGVLRQRMAEQVTAAHENEKVRASALRSADYYGPGVTGSAMGELVFGRLVAGKTPQLLGSDKLPHSVAYIEDVGQAAAVLGTSDLVLGRAWIAPHAPAMTQGQMVDIARRVLGTEIRPRVITPLMARLAGLFSPVVREVAEMIYQFTEPFVVDSGRIERELGLSPTPILTGIERTVAWYRERGDPSARSE